MPAALPFDLSTLAGLDAAATRAEELLSRWFAAQAALPAAQLNIHHLNTATMALWRLTAIRKTLILLSRRPAANNAPVRARLADGLIDTYDELDTLNLRPAARRPLVSASPRPAGPRPQTPPSPGFVPPSAGPARPAAPTASTLAPSPTSSTPPPAESDSLDTPTTPPMPAMPGMPAMPAGSPMTSAPEIRCCPTLNLAAPAGSHSAAAYARSALHLAEKLNASTSSSSPAPAPASAATAATASPSPVASAELIPSKATANIDLTPAPAANHGAPLHPTLTPSTPSPRPCPPNDS